MDYVHSCSEQSSDDDRLACAAYVKGALDGAILLTVAVPGNKPAFCLPQNVSVGQVLFVALKYMDDHPEQLQLPAIALIGTALKQAFPCGG
jgi:hypothetical protein